MMDARRLAIALAGCLCVAAGCGRDNARADAATEAPDGCNHCGEDEVDLGGQAPDLRDPGAMLNPCGDRDPHCMSASVGPPGGKFPLHTDPIKDPNAGDDGVGRDANGYLGLDQAHASFHYLWVANSEDWGRGTVSKLSSQSIREVARYLTVTCSSLATGSKQMCDGTRGCCARDDVGRWAARKMGTPEPAHVAVQLPSNNPSRTAIDFNGDLYVANRAFGGQSSVTRIANDNANCIDRNKSGRIDTSGDVNGDGVIQTDCNANGIIDDLDDVMGAPCGNGMRQEFFGLDDECILWTTQHQRAQPVGPPAGPGAQRHRHLRRVGRHLQRRRVLPPRRHHRPVQGRGSPAGGLRALWPGRRRAGIRLGAQPERRPAVFLQYPQEQRGGTGA